MLEFKVSALHTLAFTLPLVDDPSSGLFRFSGHYSLDKTDLGERTLRSNQKQTLRDRVMRGLGYGSHIERSVVSFRLTYLPPVS